MTDNKEEEEPAENEPFGTPEHTSSKAPSDAENSDMPVAPFDKRESFANINLKHADELYERARVLFHDAKPLDIVAAKVIVETANDAIKEFGNTNQEKKIELKRIIEEAEEVLPPATIEELRKRAEGKAIKKILPKSRRLRYALYAVVILIITIPSLYALWKVFTGQNEEVKPAASPPPTEPTPTAEPVLDPRSLKLAGQIEQVIIEQGHDTARAEVFVYLSIRNLGAPSIVEKYELEIKSVNLSYSSDPAELSQEYTLSTTPAGARVTLRSEDSISRKTDKPIPSGDIKRGWLRFIVPKIIPDDLRRPVTPDDLRQPGTKYIVSFVDVSGKSYSVEHTMRGSVR